MINHIIDHSLTTIRCTLSGMEAVAQMMMEVETTNIEALGYLISSCVADIRRECDAIEDENQ